MTKLNYQPHSYFIVLRETAKTIQDSLVHEWKPIVESVEKVSSWVSNDILTGKPAEREKIEYFAFRENGPQGANNARAVVRVEGQDKYRDRTIKWVWYDWHNIPLNFSHSFPWTSTYEKHKKFTKAVGTQWEEFWANQLLEDFECMIWNFAYALNKGHKKQEQRSYAAVTQFKKELEKKLG